MENLRAAVWKKLLLLSETSRTDDRQSNSSGFGELPFLMCYCTSIVHKIVFDILLVPDGCTWVS